MVKVETIKMVVEELNIFKHLASLEVEGVKSDCSFTFMFEENDSFTNKSIVKCYKVSDETDNSTIKRYKVFSDGKQPLKLHQCNEKRGP
ncbi:nucleosome assembly protein [Medicago truncatula]|uniref:Nucleosome assembly protein n=1 Tax=Medicago truncatula TaxID=3880 RepID=G7ITH6_MEDTR|nr:nucleosome assembly protein [Medicago truncatula]